MFRNVDLHHVHTEHRPPQEKHTDDRSLKQLKTVTAKLTKKEERSASMSRCVANRRSGRDITKVGRYEVPR